MRVPGRRTSLRDLFSSSSIYYTVGFSLAALVCRSCLSLLPLLPVCQTSSPSLLLLLLPDEAVWSTTPARHFAHWLRTWAVLGHPLRGQSVRLWSQRSFIVVGFTLATSAASHQRLPISTGNTTRPSGHVLELGTYTHLAVLGEGLVAITYTYINLPLRLTHSWYWTETRSFPRTLSL